MTVELTFDDGPDPTWTPAVLDALAGADVRAAFFVLAPRAAAHPGLIARMLAEGHAVELHADAHVRHTDLGRDGTAADADRGLTVLAALGVRPHRWRPPWGVTAPWTWDIAARRGLTVCGWTVDSEDWRGEPAPVLLDRVRPHVHDGAVVLFHDGLGPGATRDGCAGTVAAVRALVRDLTPAGSVA